MRHLQHERATGPWHDDVALSMKFDEFRHDPLGFVMFSYPWLTNSALQMVELPLPWAKDFDSPFGPDKWACEFLEELGDEVRKRGFDPNNPFPVMPVRMSRVSGHGIGKGVMTAWCTDWIMCTRPKARGTITAAKLQQLETKTWPEILKWTKMLPCQQRPIDKRWFTTTSGRGSMAMRHAEQPQDWFCTGQTCAPENSEAFAGQHAADSTSFYIFDESSGVPDEIHEVSEGGLTDGEPMKFAFGNGTNADGWFRNIYKSEEGRIQWHGKSVDSRDVQVTNKELLNQQVALHGENSDWVKVRVRGMFPATSSLQFLSGDDIDAAYGRTLVASQYNFAPKILTLDNAWWGDDEGVIGLRQGNAFFILRVFAKNDNDVEVAGILRQFEDEHHADAVFIDFGYGTGVVSCGKTWGRDWKLVNFGSKSPEPGYLNMRAWMYAKAKEWLKGGGAIPKDQRLYDDMYNVHTMPRTDGVIQIEGKKELRARGQPSPGRLDALVISFAFPVTRKRPFDEGGRAREKTIKEYNPYDHYRSET